MLPVPGIAMFFRIRSSYACIVGILAIALSAAAPVPAEAQRSSDQVALLSHPDIRNSPVVARGDYLIVIDLDDNELHFMQGRTILWSAPVGTGMDLKLEASNRKWQFSTPVGEYQVEYKEENPVWVAPDWFYIENKLPVPPPNDPKRRFPGALGVAAVHFGVGLAIHGTDKPDLLGQRVSHGCIRLANEYAQRLYHNVQVGTKVLIVGTQERGEMGRLTPGQVPGAGPVDARTQRLRDRAKAERTRLMNGLNALSTEALLERLEEEMAARGSSSVPAKWPETASVLIRRAVKDEDQDAARGMLEQVEGLRTPHLRAEYLTFVADLYRRATPVAALALAGLEGRTQQAAAGAIVEGTLGLFADGPEQPTAPWPSRRVLRTVLAEDAQAGYDAVLSAEQAYRERRGSGGSREGNQAARVRTGRL
jgi:hypothetical protein